jgi:hypothetical protein
MRGSNGQLYDMLTICGLRRPNPTCLTDCTSFISQLSPDTSPNHCMTCAVTAEGTSCSNCSISVMREVGICFLGSPYEIKEVKMYTSIFDRGSTGRGRRYPVQR